MFPCGAPRLVALQGRGDRQFLGLDMLGRSLLMRQFACMQFFFDVTVRGLRFRRFAFEPLNGEDLPQRAAVRG